MEKDEHTYREDYLGDKAFKEDLIHQLWHLVEELKKINENEEKFAEKNESWSKVTVVLLDKQIHWLDQLASTIRLNTKAAISRAELIRAFISAIEESNLELSGIKSEKDLKNYLKSEIKYGKN